MLALCEGPGVTSDSERRRVDWVGTDASGRRDYTAAPGVARLRISVPH
jgi:hypothetical protein